MRSAHELVDHFVRHEWGRLVALLTRRLGLCNFDLVEDVVQSTLAQALETWGADEIPDDPAGWVYRVARNKALDALRRQAAALRLAPAVARPEEVAPFDAIVLDGEIADSQLRMVFACCHEDLPDESRVALTLKALCGFSTAEIARALLTTEANAQKRVARAKEKFRDSSIPFEVPAGERLLARLASVHAVLYLLFNEGYNSSHPDDLIRADLCAEAIRLGCLLADQELCATPETFALLALMLFHAARFDARLDNEGCILLLAEQDRSAWDRGLVERARYYLNCSAQGERLSVYHIQAGIAAHHCLAPSFADTDWPSILRLYDLLLAAQASPVTELNRAVVLAQIQGPEAGIAAVERIRAVELLGNYPLLEATLGELHLRAGHPERARHFFREAARKTTSEPQMRLLERKVAQCGG